MTPQPSASHRPVAFAAFLFVVALAAFAGAFWFYDGTDLLMDLFPSSTNGAPPTPSAPTTSTADPDPRVLPVGMPEEFALRLWQEQVDSQEMIGRLISGEISSLRIDRATSDEESATLECTVRRNDADEVRGIIVLRKFDGNWFLSYATAYRDGKAPPPFTALPRKEDVDMGLLTAIVHENIKSQDVLGEYVDGIVTEVFVEILHAGPRTVTIEVEMEETHGQGYANLIAIQREFRGQPMWFLSTFTKTGHYPPEL